jgi:hypothetical protein
MEVRFDRKARHIVEDAGGVVTVEVRAVTGCMVTRRVEVRAGKPDDLDGCFEHQVGSVTVFARGVLEGPDGARSLSGGALPARVRIRHRDGTLVAEAG